MRWLDDRQLGTRIGIAVFAATLTSVLFLDFCNLAYRCGCRSLWSGADAACNIHTAGVRHCPWCSIGILGSLAVWMSIVGAQAFLALRPGQAGVCTRLLSSLAAFPIVGGILAATIGVWFGYWS